MRKSQRMWDGSKPENRGSGVDTHQDSRFYMLLTNSTHTR
ncbi:hypothetical protein ALC62_05379 [Cyphomyrmex costatus]|uniref:Uncharacterized protein n=1 Tax=Cyphomyrmex costatus TaxID=456900 RepID=A0A195CSJ5_9HYME|nr:hypothetical protein ALC62_05379 [Cyphomyrmex costatus]